MVDCSINWLFHQANFRFVFEEAQIDFEQIDIDSQNSNQKLTIDTE